MHVSNQVGLRRRIPCFSGGVKSLVLACLVGLLVAFASVGAETAPPGQRTNLIHGQLFIPGGFKTDPKGGFDLTLHLHGAPDVVASNFIAAKCSGVLANVTLPGLSAAYAERFTDTNTFWSILRETEARLKCPTTPSPQIRYVTITSFSAGFGGVREMLKDTNIFARIDAILMADSIYAGFTGDVPERKINPAHMEGFLRFAREAAEGRKRLLISHSQLSTPTYASTVETADYLIVQLGGHRDDSVIDWPAGMRLLSRFQQGHCEILGFAGDTAEHHMQHLRQLGLLLEQITR
jgi:hypothetical protein